MRTNSVIAALLCLGSIHSLKLGQEESSDLVAKMWEQALKAAEEEPPNPPHHFDLVGLASDLKETASHAVKIQKLSAHVREAKKTLEVHKSHVKEIQELMEKAEGD